MSTTEIRIFSRGGQGGVTAAKLLAYAGSLEGHEVQAIPKYGSERKGAPIFADVRISDRPIRSHSPIGNTAHHYVVLEPTLIEKLPTGLREDVIIIANATELTENQQNHLNRKTGIVDAYKIAGETNLIRSGTKLVSTIMLGAWCKATNELIKLSSLEKAVSIMFSGDLAEQNIKAIQMAYKNFKFITMELSH